MHLPNEEPSSLRTESLMGSLGSLSYENVRRWKLPIILKKRSMKIYKPWNQGFEIWLGRKRFNWILRFIKLGFRSKGEVWYIQRSDVGIVWFVWGSNQTTKFGVDGGFYASFVLLLLPRFLVEEVRVSRISCDFFSLSTILLLILPFPFANYIESCNIQFSVQKLFEVSLIN